MKAAPGTVARFDRNFFDASAPFTAIGGGELGGKAHGLAFIQRTLAERFPGGGEIVVAIPQLTVITTEHFEAFVNAQRPARRTRRPTCRTTV